MTTFRMDRKASVLIPIVLSLAVCEFATAQSTLYVRDGLTTGANDGTSWANAYQEAHAPVPEQRGLMNALAYAATHPSVTEVWVAAGTYKPDALGGSRAQTFNCRDGLAMYGGFAGYELTLSQRAGLFEQTILSGDLNGDDGPAFTNYDDNATAVVTALGTQPSTRIDGFRITGGSPVGISATFVHLVNCTIDLNNSAYPVGPGAVNAQSLSPVPLVERSIIRNNAGDAVTFTYGGIVRDNCVITNNGGVGIRTAYEGSGSGVDSIVIDSCRIVQNLYGMVIYGDAVQMSNTMILGSTGAGAYVGAPSTVINCVIAHNGTFGITHLCSICSLQIIACTIVDNGFWGADVSPGGTTTICASIFWGNQGGGPDAQIRGTTEVYNSCIQSQFYPPAQGNIYNDPVFVDPQNDVYSLLPDSPAIDKVPLTACNGMYPEFDIDGIWRGIGGGNPPGEMGAFAFAACSRNAAGTRRWRLPESGPFDQCDRWNISPPIAQWPAVFDLAGQPYSVSFTGPAQSNSLTIRQGNVAFDLGGFTYTTTASATPAIVIGSAANDFATLILTSTRPIAGTLTGLSGRIGDQQNSTGHAIVSTGGNLIFEQDLTIGFGGSGSMRVENGGRVVCRNADIGSLSTAHNCLVEVTGPNSIWQVAFFANINRGRLDVSNGGRVEAGSTGRYPGVFIFDNGTITGDGTIAGDVINFGQLQPTGISSSLTINGRYLQIAQQPILGSNSGRLTIDIDANGQAPKLDVVGLAKLGGGLFVNVPPNYAPVVGASFSILDATTITAAFDVAFMPNLTDPKNPRDPKYMRVTYGPGATFDGEGGIAGSNGVNVVVALLPGPLDFGDPNNATIPGAPTAADIGLLNNDAFLDLAITINGSPITSPGSLLTLHGDGAGNFTLQPVLLSVGVQPSGIAIGDFNAGAATGNDIAVSNAGDNTVTVKFNNGSGDFSITSSTINLPAGDLHPADIAAGDFNGTTGIDLVVVNSISNTARLLLNNNSGGFVPGLVIPTPPTPVSVDPGDVDTDRDLDFVVASSGGNSAVVMRNDGGGGFVIGATIAVGDQPVSIHLGDLDRDSLDPRNTHPEIVTTNFGDGTVSVIVNNSTTGAAPLSFAPAVNLPVGLAGSQPRSLALVALNDDPGDPTLDPDLDLAVVVNDENDEPVVRILRNDLTVNGEINPQLTFASAQDLSTGSNTQFVLAGDVDGQPGDDLVAIDAGGAPPLNDGGAAGPTPNQVSVLANQTIGPKPNPCPADIAPPPSGNGAVNVDDLLLVINSWGLCPPPCPPCVADIAPPPNGNCFVNVDDLLAVINAWGACP